MKDDYVGPVEIPYLDTCTTSKRPFLETLAAVGLGLTVGFVLGVLILLLVVPVCL